LHNPTGVELKKFKGLRVIKTPLLKRGGVFLQLFGQPVALTAFNATNLYRFTSYT
jgi:hypothetical protein